MSAISYAVGGLAGRRSRPATAGGAVSIGRLCKLHYRPRACRRGLLVVHRFERS
jgi:hypothetical protein